MNDKDNAAEDNRTRVIVEPVADTAGMAEQNREALDISRERATYLGQTAVAIQEQGFYEQAGGQSISFSDSVEAALRSKVSLPPDADLPDPGSSSGNRAFAEVRISVRNETTLTAAYRLVSGGESRVLALNFAAPSHPGGGFLSGSRAQEENLARSSALYGTLRGDPMYDFHRAEADRNLLASDWAILSPDVPVFRTDDGTLLPNVWLCSFLTCAAPQANRLPPSVDTSAVMKNRIHRVLSIARAYDYDALVLGAWGCGAFGCDPVAVAAHFREALLGPDFLGSFTEVVFAITDWSPERRFLKPFAEAFGA